MSQNGRYIPPDIKSLWMGLGLSVVCIAFFAFDVLSDLVLGSEASSRHDLIAFLFDESLEGATRKEEEAAE